MPSAPAGGARASPPRRRPASASPARARRSTGRGSAPARLGDSPIPTFRRAKSASPGTRRWSPGRPRRASSRRSAYRGPGRLAKGITTLLALQGALMGRKGNTPYVGAPGKALALYPLGTSAPPNNLTLTRTLGYKHTALAFPAIERTRLRRPLTCGRKACLAGQPNSALYHAPFKWFRVGQNQKAGRKFGLGTYTNFPMPVISAGDVLRFEAQGYQFPKSVLKQAHAGLPIIGNYSMSNRTKRLLAAKNPSLLPAVMEAALPVPSRFNRKNQLALPPTVVRKLAALGAGGRAAVVSGTAKALAAPWEVAAKARNLTGRAAASVGRGARYAASLPGRGRRALMRTLTAQERRLPN